MVLHTFGGTAVPACTPMQTLTRCSRRHRIHSKHACIHMFTVCTVNIMYREHVCTGCMHVHPFSGGARVSTHPSHSMRLERLTLWLAGARAKAILSVWYLYMCFAYVSMGPVFASPRVHRGASACEMRPLTLSEHGALFHFNVV